MHPRVPLLLLALALLVPLAGCSAAGSLDMTAVNDVELAEHASRSLPTTEDPEVAERRALVLGATRNGSATGNGTSPPVDPDGLPFAVGGAYYDLSAEAVGNHTETRVNIEVDYNGTVEGDAVAYEDLPPADRELVDAVLPPRYDGRTEGYDMGASARYTDDEIAASVLLEGDYDAIMFDGERYPVSVRDDGQVTVTEYRYTATEVASSASAYAADLRESKLFTLSGLSDAEREVVTGAVEETYYAESTDDEAFRSVLGRFWSQEAVRSDEYSGSWVVRYEGTVYWADVHYDGFDREGNA
ncbi:hypothetical protein HUG10_17310 [Halorarum halophilum]|uniref:Uncharacterized protein n=1 Tax=Halorarum halophilum TaxID=2743090 RepID=A0A7D5K9L9_9EURY|nr:hypothetical protein [Halobaculum halophilum]QLG29179.1 hypothetical protein HUG10_17310 [Halobaculum halophilum]